MKINTIYTNSRGKFEIVYVSNGNTLEYKEETIGKFFSLDKFLPQNGCSLLLTNAPGRRSKIKGQIFKQGMALGVYEENLKIIAMGNTNEKITLIFCTHSSCEFNFKNIKCNARDCSYCKVQEQDITHWMYLPFFQIPNSRKINNNLRYKIFKRDRYKCCYCGNSPAIDENIILHIDHIIPISKNGSNSEDNLQTLCSTCNLKKSNKLI